MNYFVTESFEDPSFKRLGGTKAREDIETIMKSMGMIPLEMKASSRQINNVLAKFLHHISAKKKWDALFAQLKSGDSVFIQYIVLEHSMFLYRTIKALNSRGVKVVIIVHDLDSLQSDAFVSYSKLKKKRIEMEEAGLKFAAKVIVHNPSMRDILVSNGFPADKIVVLGIFDYLLPDCRAMKQSRTLSLSNPIIISGNLAKNKSGYVYDLPENIPFNLYGVNYTGESTTNTHYKGSFDPEEIPYVMEGSFGLVWDGVSTETCTGRFGEYLKINNPHKTSLYLVSGIPVAIWKSAALAQFISENKCGVTIDSISDLYEIRNKLSEEEYNELARNAQIIGEKLRNGEYIKAAIAKSLE